MLKGAFVFGGVYDHRGWSAWLARGSGASEAEVTERRGMSVVRGRGAALDARQTDLTARVERLEAMGAVGRWTAEVGFGREDGKNSASAVWILPLRLLIPSFLLQTVNSRPHFVKLIRKLKGLCNFSTMQILLGENYMQI